MSWCHGSRRCYDYLTYMWCLNHFLRHVIIVNIWHNLDICVNSSIPWFILNKLKISTDYHFHYDRIIQLVCFSIFRVEKKYIYVSSCLASFSSNLELWAYATQPKTFKWVTLWFILVHASWGTLFFTLFVRHQFMIYTRATTAFAQYSFGKCLATIMMHAISIMVMFFLSETLFSWGVYHAVNFFCMPWVLQKFINSFETYSPPMSVLNILMWCPLWFSTSALNCWKQLNALDLCFTKYTHVFLQYSSIQVRK